MYSVLPGLEQFLLRPDDELSEAAEPAAGQNLESGISWSMKAGFVCV